MKKLFGVALFLLGTIQYLFAQSQPDIPASDIFNGDVIIEFSQDTLMLVNFETSDVNIVTRPKKAASPYSAQDFRIDTTLQQQPYSNLFVFGNRFYVDSMYDKGVARVPLRNFGNSTVSTGKYNPFPLTGLNVSSKSFVGLVELVWSTYADATGYLVFRLDKMGDINAPRKFLKPIANIRSGITPTHNDADIDFSQSSYDYYVLAYNLDNRDDMFVSAASGIKGEINNDMRFSVIGGNEELVSIKWEYDNSLLSGREFGSINEIVRGDGNGEIYNHQTDISEFNVGNSRLQFQTIELVSSADDEGINLALPQLPLSTNGTVEFWVNPGTLTGQPKLLIYEPDGYYLGISNLGIYAYRYGGQRPIEVLDHPFKSNTWAHLTLANKINELEIIIDGKAIGSFANEGFETGTPNIPYYLGASTENDNSNEVNWPLAQARVGMFRQWSSTRNAGQIKEDLYDIYEIKDLNKAPLNNGIQNLLNQWSIEEGLNIIPGLKPGAGYAIISEVNGSNFIGPNTIDEAYIFDRKEIAKIVKLKTTVRSDVFYYDNFEVGSGKSLLSDFSNEDFIYEYGEGKDFVNVLGVSYNKTEHLGKVDISYLPGSSMPKEYFFMKRTIETPEVDYDTLAILKPRQVKHAFSFDITSDLNVAMRVPADKSGRTYSMMLRIPYEETDSDNELIAFNSNLKLIANRQSELELVYKPSVPNERKGQFISSLKKRVWNQLDLVVTPDASSAEWLIIPYLNGLGLDTLKVGIDDMAFTSEIALLPSTRENKMEVAYLAALGEALDENQIAMNYQLVPDLHEHWALIFNDGIESELSLTHFDGPTLKTSTIADAGISSLTTQVSNLENSFVNYGNVISRLEYSDIFSDTNVIEADETIEYSVLPHYPASFHKIDPSQEQFKEVENVEFPDLEFAIAFVNESRSIQLSWNQDNLSTWGCDSVAIYKEATLLGNVRLSNSYIDKNVAMGQTYSYSIRPIKQGVEVFNQSVSEAIPADGRMEGFIVSGVEDIIIPNTAVTLFNTGEDLVITSDASGRFDTTGIDYGFKSDFKLANVDKTLNLSKGNPKLFHQFIPGNKNYGVERVSTILDPKNLEVSIEGELIHFNLPKHNSGIDQLDGNPHFVNVYLNDSLVRIIPMAASQYADPVVYIDSLARLATNDFTFKLYYFQTANKVVLDSYTEKNVSNGEYAKIQSLNLEQKDNGEVLISWVYPVTSKINAFNIYRINQEGDTTALAYHSASDYEIIDDQRTYAFHDKWGIPGEEYNYCVAPAYKVEEQWVVLFEYQNQQLESYPTWSNDVINASFGEANDEILVTYHGWMSHASDGLLVKEDGKVVGWLPKPDYLGTDGATTKYDWLLHGKKPGTMNYSLALFKYAKESGRDSVYVFDLGVIKSIDNPISGSNFTSISTTMNDATARDNFFYRASWEADIIPHTYLVSATDNIAIDFREEIPGTWSEYTFADHHFAEREITFQVTPLDADGNALGTFIDEKVTFRSNINKESIASASHFRASKEGFNKLKLMWDYPDYAFGQFILYRDGVEIAQLNSDQQYYVDNDPIDHDKLYSYQLKVIYDEFESELLATVGKKVARNAVSLNVIDKNFKPIPFAKVDLWDVAKPSIKYSYYTDSLGMLCIDDLYPQYTDRFGYQVHTIDLVNASDPTIGEISFSDQNQTLDLLVNKAYHFYPNYSSEELIPTIAAYADIRNNSVKLKWVTATEDIDRFEIYHNNAYQGAIGEVRANEVFEFVHSTPFLDAENIYSIVPILKNVNGEDVFNTYKAQVEINMPDIDPVNFLTAKISVEEGAVELDWVHDYANTDKFMIERSISEIARINNEITTYIDDTGLPESDYLYKVYPVFNEKAYNVASTSELRFPSIATVKNFKAEENQSNYTVDLSWEYPSTSRELSGVRIYREDNLIAELAATESSYNDASGFPNTKTRYEITSAFEVTDNNDFTKVYESERVMDTVIYPTLTPVDPSSVDIITSIDTVEISWAYASESFDYFLFNYKVIDEDWPAAKKLLKAEADRLDNGKYVNYITGFAPGTQLDISFRAVKEIEGFEYLTEEVIANASFSNLPLTASNFKIKKFSNAYYVVTWEYPAFEHLDELYMNVGSDRYDLELGTQSFYYTIPNSRISHTNFNPVFDLHATINGEKLDLGNGTGSRYNAPGFISKLSSSPDQYGVKIGWSDVYDGSNHLDRSFAFLNNSGEVDIHTETVHNDIAGYNTEYMDTDAVPGLRYIYNLNHGAYVSGNYDYLPVQGSTPGKANVTVLTTVETGSTPVSDIEFTLKGRNTIDYIFRKGKSGEDGILKFDNLPQKDYLGNNIVYEIKPRLPEEDYDWNESKFTFSTEEEVKVLTPLKYKKVYTIQGSVTHEICTGCGVDTVSVNVTTFDDANYQTQSSGAEVVTVETDKYGKYALSVPKVSGKFYQVAVKRNIPSQSTLDPQQTGSEYQFIEEIANDTVRFSGADFLADNSYLIDFKEQTKYPLKLQVVDPCLDPLGDYKFKIRIKDDQNRYDTTVFTNQQGELDILVPPYDLVAQVEAVDNPDAFSVAVLDFFRPRRFDFSYQSLYYEIIDELATSDTDSLALKGKEYVDLLFDDPSYLVYSRTPIIEIADIANEGDKKTTTLNGESYHVFYGEGTENTNKDVVEITFRVEDNGCPIDSKVLMIKNPGALQVVDFAYPFAEENGEIVEYYPDGEYKYRFVANTPNMSYPYTHLMEIYLIDLDPSLYRVKPQDIGKSIASLEYEYIITGATALEGKDVFVEPGQDAAGNINVPLMVLRDPPGDHSYSYIEKGTEISFDFQSSLGNANRQTWSYGDQFELFLYSNSNVAWSKQAESETKKSSKLTFKFNEKITTAKQSQLSTNIRGYLDGREADVIVGTGFAYQYGVKDVLEYDHSSNELTKAQEYGITPTEVSTVWYFNRSIIDQTIKYYESLQADKSVDPDFSEVVRFDTENNTNFDPLVAAENWRAVLQNVDFAAHPLCQMLDLSRSIDGSSYISSLTTILLDETFPGGGKGLAQELISNAEHHLDNLASLDALLDITQAEQLLAEMPRYANLDWSKAGNNSSDRDEPCFCKTVDPVDYIFHDLLDESQGGERDIILNAYESARKINIIDNYAFDQLSTVIASTEIDLPYLQSLMSIADDDVLDQLSTFLGYSREEILNMSEDELNQLINENWSDTGSNGVTAISTIGVGSLISSAFFVSRLSATSGISANRAVISRVLSNTDNLRYANKAALTKVAKARTAVKTAKAAMAATTVVAVANLITSVTASHFMQKEHDRVSSKIYEELRKDFYADLGAMVDASSPNNKLVQSYSRRNGIENITFSGGGQEIARSYTDTDQSSFSVEGYESSRFSFDIGAGIALEAKTSLGWIVECADCIKFKNKFGFGVDVNQQLDQKVKTETSTSESTTTGYVLADDDDGDQFNIYVLNAAIPSASTAITPYFYLVGGRSSGPYEEGTISRDLPTITIEDSTGTKYPSVFLNQDPSQPVRVPLKITAGNRFEEGRSLGVTIAPNSNASGAEYLMNNAEVYVGREAGFFVEPGEAVYTNLFVKQNGDIYDYEDLSLVVRPWDVKSDFFADGKGVFDTLDFQVYFRKPLPHVSLSEHDGQWIIKRSENDDDKENYIFYLKDYDVDLLESDLAYIEMQYKREGEQFTEWQKMARTFLDEEGVDYIIEQISIEELKEFYETNARTYLDPTFLFDWDITGLGLVDGNYLVRAIAYDENGQFEFSNVYSGIIDRKGPQIADAPEPKDQLLSQGDQIHVSFDETIDNEFYTAHGFSRLIIHPLDSSEKSDTLYTHGMQYPFTVNATSGAINVDLLELPEWFDGHQVTVELFGVKDAYGNTLEESNYIFGDTIRWTFQLDYYKQTPSTVELISDDNWTYTLQDTANTTLDFIVSGYDVFEKSTSLTRIDLEVSQIGSGQWSVIDTKYQEELLSEFLEEDNPNIVPQSIMRWKLDSADFNFTDGAYQVRVKSFGDFGQFYISGSVSGVIDRAIPQLNGLPQPADQILSRGETVNFSYNESIDFESGQIAVKVFTNEGPVAEENYQLTVSSSGINVAFTDAYMTDFPPSDSVKVSVKGVTDLVGNTADSVETKFKIDYFSSQVSTISLVGLDNWLQTSNTTDEYGVALPLPIVLSNYQLFDAGVSLDSIQLQFRPLQQANAELQGWEKMILVDPAFYNVELTKEVLTQRFKNRNNLSPGDIPVDTVYWDSKLIPDGSYEIRAVAHGQNGYTISSHVVGKIDRTPPALASLPNPQDGILGVGDQASLSFTEKLNYAILSPEQLKDSVTVHITSGDTIAKDEFEITCSGNEIRFALTYEATEKYFREELFIEVSGITDMYGNGFVYLVDWRFKVDHFKKVPSYANIESPKNFLINKELFDRSDSIKVVVTEYDLHEFYNTLDVLELQIKRADLNDEPDNWFSVDQLTKEQLKANYDARLAFDENSRLADTLYIRRTNYTSLIEGQYDIRVRIKGGNDYNYSNVVSGTVDLRAPGIASISPSDGMLSLGDNLRIDFDQNIDVEHAIASLASGRLVEVIHLDAEDASDEVVTDFFATPSIISSKLEFIRMDSAGLEPFDGDEFEVRVRDVYDLHDNGTPLLSWKFQLDLKRYGPSPVNIKSPSGPFVVNQSKMSVDVVIDGFDFSNTTYLLDEIRLEYRQVTGGDDTWILVETFDLPAIESQNQGLTAPELDYVWDIDANGDGLADLPDGDYLLRAVSVAGNQTQFSGTRGGVIDALKPQLITFSPSDGIYSRGDEISFTFNESLREDVLVSFDVAAVEGDYTTFDDDIVFLRTQSSNKVVLSLKAGQDLSAYDGDTLWVKLTDVADRMGNSIEGGVERFFVIDFFKRPPSPVALKADNNFIVSSNSSETLELRVDGYDLYQLNYTLDRLVLELRETSGDNQWRELSSKDRSTLAAEQDLLPAGVSPETTFDLETAVLVDGTYEVRMVAYGGDQFSFSNSISGVVDKTSPLLTFEPQDGFYSLNDYLGFTVNEGININEAIDLRIVTLEGEDLSGLFNKIESSGGVALLIDDYEDLAPYDAQRLQLMLNDEVKDLHGNAYTGATGHSFVVNYEKRGISGYDVVDPVGEVVINKQSPRVLDFVIQGYDLTGETELEKVELLVQYPDVPNVWERVGMKRRSELNPLDEANSLTQDTLTLAIGQGDPEGIYLLQFRSYGEGDQYNVVHATTLTVDRLSPELISFDPQDGILSLDDQIRYSFNESLRANPLVPFSVDHDGADITSHFNRIQSSTSVTLQPLIDLQQYHGEELTVSISGVYDKLGNVYEGDLTRTFQVDYETLIPSPVTLKGVDGFVVNATSSNKLDLRVDGYDLYGANYTLDSMDLQVRRVVGASQWKTVDRKGIHELREEHLDKRIAPQSAFTIQTKSLEEGPYEVRVKSYGKGQYEISNMLSGNIDRTAPAITFEPVDGFYSRNDHLGFRSDETLNVFADIGVLLTTGDGHDITGLFNKVQTNGGVELLVKQYDSLAPYDGQQLTLSLTSDIHDAYGNVYDGVKTTDFLVDFERKEISSYDVVDPTGTVLINQESLKTIDFIIQGYELSELFKLDEVALLVQYPDETNTWSTVTSKSRLQLNPAPGGGEQTQDTLSITIANEDPDGTYLLQFRSYAGDQFNVVHNQEVQVDRIAPQLERFSPSDSILSMGDDITFDFNESLIGSQLVDFSATSNGEDVSSLFRKVEGGSTVTIIANGDLGALDGETIDVTLMNIYDEAGNSLASSSLTLPIRVDYFSKPASNVEIKSPSDFAVNAMGPSSIDFVVTGYDVFEFASRLDSLVLEYRYLERASEWEAYATQNIAYLLNQDTEEPLTRFSLGNESWQHGEYAVRVLSYGGSRVAYSNEVNGIIDLLSPKVLGVPSPSDKILDVDDEISVTFNEAILADNAVITITNISKNESVAFETVYTSDLINLSIESTDRFESVGDSLEVVVSGVRDVYGNEMDRNVSWSFIVNNEDLELSDLTLTNDGWVVNQSVEDVPLAIPYSNVDPISNELDSVVFEYRNELSVTWTKLASFDREEAVAQMSQVADTLFWNTSNVNDGGYEVRGLVYGFGGMAVEKSRISGVIDRVAPNLLSQAPADSSYQYGDEISFRFDEEIDCLNDYSYEVQLIDGDLIRSYDELSPVCDVNGALLFGPNNEALFDEKGKTVKIVLSEVYDQYGNGIDEPIEWSFIVGDFFLETSPVRLKAPDQDFLINEISSGLPVSISEYDFTKSKYALDSIAVQFSATFENEWKTFWSGTAESLKDHYLSTGRTYFDLSWDPGTQVTDGFYTLRAVAYGNGGVPSISESILGEIDRNGPSVSNIEKDADGVIEVSLSEILSGDLSEATIEMKQMVNGVSSSRAGRVSATQKALSNYATISSDYYDVAIVNKQLSVSFDHVMMNEFGDHEVELFITGVKDRNGNVMSDEIYTSMMVPARHDSTGSSLKGTYNGKGGIDLSWYYSGAMEAEGFIVERLYNTVFEQVGALTEIHELVAYGLTDAFNYKGEVYYRLKYVGKEDVYSKIIKVTLDDALEITPIASVYPNPSTDKARIKFKLLTRDFDNKIAVRVFSDQGLLVTKRLYKPEEVEKTVFEVELKSELSSGIYYVEIVQGEHLSVQKMIVQ